VSEHGRGGSWDCRDQIIMLDKVFDQSKLESKNTIDIYDYHK